MSTLRRVERLGPDESDQTAYEGLAPKRLLDVLIDTNRKVAEGALNSYVPAPSGFDPLDRVIGGGFKRGELILLGGAQGIGKTICVLQMARNLALNPNVYPLFVSFEHDEEHLLSRLLCMESIDPTSREYQTGLKMKELRHDILMKRSQKKIGLYEILQTNPRAKDCLEKMQPYCQRLHLIKANPTKTDIPALHYIVSQLKAANSGAFVVVLVDYLQKIPVLQGTADESEKITLIVNGLKDLALTQDCAVVSIVAADREGLKAKRLHLHHLRGSSALDYEADIALILNNKHHVLSEVHIDFNPHQAEQYKSWVVFSVEKNRAGQAGVDMEFQLKGEYFCFNPEGAIVTQKLVD